MAAIITLTTDFGLTDSYVAAMKGVILGINPEVKLVDISHNIRPQDITQAAFILGTACHFFPRQTIHLVVVDPGVGTDRLAIILKTDTSYFVAPDNGVLSQVIRQAAPELELTDGGQATLEPGLDAVAITQPQFRRTPVSPTFHGRDIFAPVAAHLSRGLPISAFGETVTSLTMLPQSQPYRTADGTLVGHIIHIDSFGNLITDIRRPDLPPPLLAIEAGGQIIPGISLTYAPGEGLTALISSSGYLEIAVNKGSAAAQIKAEIGNEVKIIPRDGS